MAPQWADQPLALISTLAFSKNTSHSAYYVATQMALAHNGIIRGLNSIYIQAPHIPSSDIGTVRDFLTYCQCWCESMHHHHDAEEALFFPDVERISGVQGLMENNVQQHRAFTAGFETFAAYAKSCAPEQYDGKKVTDLIDGFAAPLHRHLNDEVETLKSLHQYDDGEIRQAYKRFEQSLMNGDKYRIAPLIFGTADRGFEGGIHAFPPVPFFVPYIIHYVFERQLQGSWRFNPCTTWRDRRELEFAGTHPDSTI